MKKNVLLILILLLLFPLTVFGVTNVDYNITKYSIEADILNNGDVNVCEYIKLDGSFNGYVREIHYKDGGYEYNPTDLTNLNVYDLNVNNMTKGNAFSYDDSAVKGDVLKYTYEPYYNYSFKGIDVTMYNANNRGEKGFVLCYTLSDTILIHNDVAELYYNFVPSGFSDVLRDVTVKVNLNGIDESLRVWAHGALQGEVSKEVSTNNSYLLATIKRVNPGEVVNVRMTFDKKFVSEGVKVSNRDALKEIIDEETELANKANKEREAERNKLFLYFSVNLVVVGYFIFSIIYCYFKYDKEHKVDFNMEYYREFPNTYGPEILEYLIKHVSTSEGYSACILNMIYKKNLILTQTDNKKDYILTKSETQGFLSCTENLVLDFIIDVIGDGKSVRLNEIKKYGKTETKARKFIKNFDKFKKEVKNEIDKYNFFESKKHNKFVYINIALTAIMFYILCSVGFGLLSMILGLISVFYILSISKRTKEGMLEYKKWMAFKKFLLDFGRFNEKELP